MSNVINVIDELGATIAQSLKEIEEILPPDVLKAYQVINKVGNDLKDDSDAKMIVVNNLLASIPKEDHKRLGIELDSNGGWISTGDTEWENE